MMTIYNTVIWDYKIYFQDTNELREALLKLKKKLALSDTSKQNRLKQE